MPVFGNITSGRGTRAEIRSMAPTLLGMWYTAGSSLTVNETTTKTNWMLSMAVTASTTLCRHTRSPILANSAICVSMEMTALGLEMNLSGRTGSEALFERTKFVCLFFECPLPLRLYRTVPSIFDKGHRHHFSTTSNTFVRRCRKIEWLGRRVGGRARVCIAVSCKIRSPWSHRYIVKYANCYRKRSEMAPEGLIQS